MFELGRGPCLAQEAVEIFSAGQIAAARDLDGDDSVELWIARLVDGAEGPDPQLAEQLELAQAALAWPLPPVGGGRGPFELKARPAGRANHFIGFVGNDLDRVQTVRAVEVHRG